MKLPTAEQYIDIVSRNSRGMELLSNYQFILEDGVPYYQSGRNTIIFKTRLNSQLFAARFFLNDDPELFRRYYEVQRFLDSKQVAWKVPFQFIDNGLHPLLLMQWLESSSLSEYIDSIVTDPGRITELQTKLLELSRSLEANGIGHGNLNLNHIRIIKEGSSFSIKLIDYDSMFIAPFKGKTSFGVGTPGFQHPMRLASDYAETIDRFSFWVLLTALEAFKKHPELWLDSPNYNYNKTENILFSFSDLASPKQSATFQLLKGSNDEALNFYVQKLFEFCNLRSPSLTDAPWLYGQYHKSDVNGRPKPDTNITVGISTDVRPKKSIPTPATPSSTTTLIAEKKIIKKPIEKTKEPLVQVRAAEKRKPATSKTKKSLMFAVGIAVIVAGFFLATYLLKQNQAAEPGQTQNSLEKTAIPVTDIEKSQPVFTSQKVSTFLSQLYQDYNKRQLDSILANYAPQVNQYYDAGSLNQEKLSDVIQDLFIKPSFYQCEPDFGTFQFRESGNNCIASITINERIQASANARRESYVSQIEYTIDSSFKIVGERTIE